MAYRSQTTVIPDESIAGPIGLHDFYRRFISLLKSQPQRIDRALLLDLLILLVAAVPALLPLAASGNLQGSDATDPPWRSLALRLALGDRVVFPRWTPELFYGYGFPCFQFYAPLSFYPAVFIEAATRLDFLESTKVAYAISFVISGAGAYLLARQLIPYRSAALLSGVLYMYAPYLLGEIYVRSSLAGLSGLALLPFALTVFVKLCRRPTLRDAGLGAFLLATLALTHNVTCLLTCGMVAGFVVLHFFQSRDRRSLALAILSILLGLGAASFFWVPAMVEMEYVHTESLHSNRNDPLIHLVDPLGDVNDIVHKRGWWEDYKITKWGAFDLHPAYPYGPPPYKISLFQGILFIFGGIALGVTKRRPRHITYLFILALLMFFIHTTWSQWVWDRFPFLVLISYPWRVTGPIGLCLAVVGAWTICSVASKWRVWLMLSVAAAAVLSGVWALPTQLGPFENGVQVTRENLIRNEYYHRARFGTWTDFLMLPLSVQWENISGQDVIIRYDQSFPPSGWVADAAFVSTGSKAWILAARRGQEWMEADVETGEPTLIAFHTIFFPGWTAYLDGQKVPVVPSSWQEYEHNRKAALGVCQVLIPEGKHHVALVFEDTPVRRWSEMVAASCILGIGGVFLASLWSRFNCSRSGMSGVKFALAVVLGVGAGLAGYQAFTASAKTPVWVDNRVVLDLVKQAEQGELDINVPSDASANDYLYPKDLTINGDSRRGLYMHPPASASTKLWVPEKAVLEFAMGIDPAVWDKAGDGVRFQVEIQDGGGAQLLFDKYIDPKSISADRQWIQGQVDLSDFAHREVKLLLRSIHGNSDEFDWAFWASPRVVLNR